MRRRAARTMVMLQLLPAVISLLLLGAHFLRAGDLGVVALVLGLVALLFVRRPWARRTVQVGLALGVLVWVQTLVGLAQARQLAGQPYERLVIILGAVALLTALAGLALEARAARERFGPPAPPPPPAT